MRKPLRPKNRSRTKVARMQRHGPFINVTTRIVVLSSLLIPFFVNETRAEDMLVERNVAYGSGTPGDPLTYETWHDWDQGGVANLANSKLVYKSVYTGNTIITDSRDVFGTGQHEYESEDIEIIKEWEWNRDDLADPTGTRVLTQHDGYHTYYQGLDEYDVGVKFDIFERIVEKWFANLTAAQLDPPIHATRRISGTDAEYEYIWLMPTQDYMTLEREISTDIETNMDSGTQIERSETPTAPVNLITITTNYWGEFDDAMGVWVQQQSVNTTTAPLFPEGEED